MSKIRYIVETRIDLNDIETPEENDEGLVKDEGMMYEYKNEVWTVKGVANCPKGEPGISGDIPPEEGMKLTIYDFNRNILETQGPKKNVESIIKETILNDMVLDDTHYLLYGKEIGYFTLFEFDEISSVDVFADYVLECLLSIGTIYNEEYIPEENAYELWVMMENELLTYLYLFGFDNGVVHVGEEYEP